MLSLILPRQCPVCHRRLLPGEDCICLRCLAVLPRIHAERPNNAIEYHLAGKFSFEHATSFCYYRHESALGGIIRLSKFGGQPWLNTGLTRLFVQELQLIEDEDGVGWPYDIDVIVPIPVHFLRLLTRGYNQSMAICEALHEAWRLPIESRCLYKSRFTNSQVGQTGEERKKNVEGSFSVRHPERLHGRHILLVDDVLTSGATLTSAADALYASVKDIKISVLTLTFAGG